VKLQSTSIFKNRVIVHAPTLVLVHSKKFMGCTFGEEHEIFTRSMLLHSCVCLNTVIPLSALVVCFLNYGRT
jgi:hypothetical protein